MKLIYNGSGYGREIRSTGQRAMPREEFLLVDDALDGAPDGAHEGDAVSFEEACRRRERDGAQMTVAFADPALRRRKTAQALEAGFELFSIVAPNAVICDNVAIGPGAQMMSFSYCPPNLAIGAGFHCGVYSYVGHDSVVGDFVTLAPRVSIGGCCVIEDDVYFGTGATVLPGKPGRPMRIGRGAVIGAQALVTADVPPGATMVGIPAKPLKN